MTGKIKLNATSGGGSISLNAPSSAGSDTDFLDTSGNLAVSGNVTCANDLSVDNDLKIDSGFGSTSTVYGCRAWIQLDQSGSQSITGSGGVSSISDSGTGATTINFTTTMPDDNYAIVGGAQQSSSSSVNFGFSLCIQSYNTTNAQFIYRPSASSDTKEDSSKVSIAFFR